MSSLNHFSNLTVKETATLIWTIDEFAQVEKAKSSEFSLLGSRNEFRLELNSKIRAFNLERVLLELFYNKHEKDVLLRYRISILDVDGEKHHTKEYLWHFQDEIFNPFCNFNVTSYILGNKCNELLVNGNLKIYCEVDILEEKFSHQQIESYDKLSENHETLLESGKLTDFTVQIGKKDFRVHKAILAARSAVFAAMFEHDAMKEVKEGRVVIEDLEVEVFELMIRYIYTGKIDDELDEYEYAAAELFVAADRYQLDHLKSICEQSLISNLEIESVAGILLLSDMHNAQQLKSKCIEYISDNWKEVKQTEAWKEQIVKGKRTDLVEKILDAFASNNENNNFNSD